MKNINKYISQVVRNITPYKWEDEEVDKYLIFYANTMPYPPSCLNKYLESLKKECPINEYYNLNYPRLKALIAKYENVSAGNIVITNSGDEAIDILAKTFLNPDDFFITTPPTYDMFSIQCKINRGVNFPVPLIKDTWEVNARGIIKASQNPKVKLIFLGNPNNPTASIIPQEILNKIIRESKAIVVVDEVYREFYGKSAVSLLSQYKNLVILRSFSKFAAIAGARIGYLIADRVLSQKFDAVRLPFGLSYFSYKFAEFVMEKDQKWIGEQVDMIKKERSRLTKELTSLGFYVYPSYANFLLVRIGPKAKEVVEKLKAKKIIIRDRSSKKYLDDCVRITVRSRQENQKLIKTLKEIL